jgi:hypothetical protein
MTRLEASSLLYRAQLYCDSMAYRQRTDERRRDYNETFLILRERRVIVDREYAALGNEATR